MTRLGGDEFYLVHKIYLHILFIFQRQSRIWIYLFAPCGAVTTQTITYFVKLCKGEFIFLPFRKICQKNFVHYAQKANAVYDIFLRISV